MFFFFLCLSPPRTPILLLHLPHRKGSEDKMCCGNGRQPNHPQPLYGEPGKGGHKVCFGMLLVDCVLYVDLCVTTTTFGSGTQVTFYQESSLTHQTDSCDKARRQRHNAGLALKTESREGLRQQGITTWQG